MRLRTGLSVFPGIPCMLVGLTILTFLAGCGAKPEEEDTHSKTISGPRVLKVSDDVMKRLDVKTEVVEKRPVAVPLHLTGRIEPDIQKEVDLSTRIAGRISDIFVLPGEHVQKGQRVALVDSQEISDLQSQLIEARSKLTVAELHQERERQILDELIKRPTELIKARATFNSAKVQKELAETEFDRIQGLYKEKIAAAKDFVTAKANLAKAQVNFDQAQANLQREEHLYKNRAMLKRDFQLAQAEASRARNHVNMLNQRLNFLGCGQHMLDEVVSTGKIVGSIQLTAPISGVVTYRDVSVGELVQPDRVIFTISDMSTVMLRVDLPESDLKRVKLGDRVKIRLASYPDELFQGVVSYISVIVDQATRTVAVRARLENKDGILKKFMFAEIELEGAPEVVLACPKDAIQEHGGEKIVFVKTAEGFEERRVKVGFEGERFVQIKSGLGEGEAVATQGSLMLKTEITYQH